MAASWPTGFRLATANRAVHVRVTGRPDAATVQLEDDETRSLTASLDGSELRVTIDGCSETYRVAESDGHLWLSSPTGIAMVREVAEVNVRTGDAHAGEADLTSPMPGTVIAVGVVNGAVVTAGTTIVVVEAMKMEHALTAPVDGTVDLHVAAGEQVTVDQLLARVIPASTDTEKGAPA